MKFMTKMLVLSALAIGCGGGGDEEGCTEGEVYCDGDLLIECIDGAEVESDCAADGMMCHEEMGHCMEMTGEGDMSM
jgi:hypothetical protein